MNSKKKKNIPKIASLRNYEAATKFRTTITIWQRQSTCINVTYILAFSVGGTTAGPRHI